MCWRRKSVKQRNSAQKGTLTPLTVEKQSLPLLPFIRRELEQSV